jgi:hypothetical protein
VFGFPLQVVLRARPFDIDRRVSQTTTGPSRPEESWAK